MSTRRTKPLKRSAPTPRKPAAALDPEPEKPAADEQAESPAEAKRSKVFIQPAVLKHVRDANGQPVTLPELQELLGCRHGAVQYAANQLSKKVPQFRVVTRGQVWRWNSYVTDVTGDFGPVPEPDKEQAEVWYLEVGHDSQGNPLVRRDGGTEVKRVVDL